MFLLLRVPRSSAPLGVGDGGRAAGPLVERGGEGRGGGGAGGLHPAVRPHARDPAGGRGGHRAVAEGIRKPPHTFLPVARKSRHHHAAPLGRIFPVTAEPARHSTTMTSSK